MKVVVYPADRYGCGHFRMIWPAQQLAATGHDVRVVTPEQRRVRMVMDGDRVTDVLVEADVVVMQRVTHRWQADAVAVMRAKGIAVVVDIDDDLTAVHPSNPAWASLHPAAGVRAGAGVAPSPHSWRNLTTACRNASLVTVSTPALLPVYSAHGRGHVLPNYLPPSYFGLPRTDSDTIGWPAALHSHPNDPEVLGGAIARLVGEGGEFVMRGDPRGAGRALGLSSDPPGAAVPVEEWPRAVAELGIGIAPLADTKFNAAKSWLKPLEMSALGVPWVASPRAEYRRLHELGAGLLADRSRTWHRELKRLRESAALRAELSEAGRQVADGLRLADHAWRWADAWQRAADIQAATPRPTVPV
ncbi:hypothetical protein [Streptomyces iconiensis]|uniref:Glycosyltransferase n=1 Tax=Streptomyces iconiensis TaxID=1384038 RepID=A0ABT7AA63_9ACTN|nr:hypothetical protein [Streptomyces iconiensis]MDJ1137937.1 hypothetical protein [Streptomyces iconiensis]